MAVAIIFCVFTKALKTSSYEKCLGSKVTSEVYEAFKDLCKMLYMCIFLEERVKGFVTEP